MSKSTLLIQMIELLRQSPGLTVAELSSALNRSKRTVYRWLSELAGDLHTPIYCENGGYFLWKAGASRAVALEPQELLALKLSLKSSPFSQGSPVGRYAESAWRKIREAVPYEKLSEACGLTAGHSVNVTSTTGEPFNAVLETIENAVSSRRRLRIVYRSQKSNRVKEYAVDPYAVVFRRHSWYLVGFCLDYGEIRQFKLVRFRDAVDTGIRFEAPDGFDVEEYFKLSWEAWAGGEPTDVRVRFSPRVAHMILETKRHPTQAAYPQSDGSVILEVMVAGIKEIAIWIMGFGKDAEVLDPESLRDFILDHAMGMAAHYAKVDKEIGELVG